MIEFLFQIKVFFEKLLQTIFSVFRIIYLTKIPSALPEISKPNCAILGNGPSLTESLSLHNQFISECELVCVNFFAKSEYFAILKPQNYVFLDPAFFLPNGYDDDRHKIDEFYKKMSSDISWNIYIYAPIHSKKSKHFTNSFKNNKFIKIVYFNYSIYDGFDFIGFPLLKKGLAAFQCQNVLAISLFLMINRRFKQIYILGADHSWHENIRLVDNKILIKDNHFYDQKNTSYRALYNSQTKMGDQFMAIAKTFYGYYRLANYAKYRNVQIYNASLKSYIDAFQNIIIN